MMTADIRISNTPLHIDTCYSFVANNEAGGVNIFIGNVRNNTNGRTVVKLDFECYEKMALTEMQKIAADANKIWGISHVAIHHRIGSLLPGDTAVIIAVASPHRAASFAACQYIIDTLKQTVPIWKKEYFTDGSHWVSAHP